MAARENQGYLIAVIVLVLLCLVLALTSFFCYVKAGEHATSRAQTEAALQNEKNLKDAYRIKSDILKALVGEMGNSVAEVDTSRNELDDVINKTSGGDREAIDSIKKDIDNIFTEYQKDMTLFLGANTEGQPNEPTWRGLVRNFSSALNKKYADLQIALNEQARVEREAKKDIDAKQKEVEQTKEQLTLAQNDLSKKNEEFESYKKTTTTVLEDIQKTNLKVETEKNQVRDTLTGQINVKQTENEQLAEQNVLLKTKVDNYEKEQFDLADGRIVRASQGNVFLNIGSKDGLKTGRTFSVYAEKDTNFERSNPKASIEVIDVNEHQAQARVISENYLDPIVAGDQIINPVWDPGYAVPIALAGVFDMDHDGFDDRDRLIQMIKQNGGNVVAFHDSEGNVVGEVNSATRYLVVGDSPALDPDSNPLVMKAMRNITDQARKYQIQEIDTRKLMNWMGLHSQPVIEKLDKEIGEQYRKLDAKSRDQ